jgi:hypothetical protein
MIDMVQCSNMVKYIWWRAVPLGLVVSEKNSSPGYKYSRFLSMSAVCSLRYG